MTERPDIESIIATSRLNIGFEVGDSVSIGGVVHGIDVEGLALITPGGRRVSLNDGAAVEVVPGLHAQAVSRPHLGPLAIAFWGRGDVPIVRLRGGSVPPA